MSISSPGGSVGKAYCIGLSLVVRSSVGSIRRKLEGQITGPNLGSAAKQHCGHGQLD